MATKLIPRADVRRAAGRLVICGFEGTSVTAELRELLREVQPLGVILFARNIESLEQICELNRELKALRPGEPLLCTVDQEGGRVARIGKPATVWPSLRALGRLGDADLVQAIGRAIAVELRALNFDINYAPVLDVDINPQNPVIGDRSFSADPRLVARLGAAFIAGLQAEGVGGCGKHFPGHGDTDKDSHLELPYVEHELQRLREVEWPPFRAAIAAGVGAIMTAHLVVMPIDERRPATLSPPVLAHLRNELGFLGAIISDDIEMKAIADHYRPDELAGQGVNAGVDVFLACKRPDVVLDLYRGIVQAVEAQTITHETLMAAEQRALTWRQRFVRPATPWSAGKDRVGPAAHGALAGVIEKRLTEGV